MKENGTVHHLAQLFDSGSVWKKQSELVKELLRLKSYASSENWLSFLVLISEFEKVTDEVLKNVSLQNKKIENALRVVIDYLPKCIDLLSNGCEDNPVYFAPLLNDLRAILHEPFFSENTLYFPTISTPLIIERITRQQRMQFHQGLLELQYQQQKSSAWDTMIQSIASLKVSCRTTAHADLWNVTYIFLMLLKDEILPETYAIDHVLKQLDCFLKMQVELIVGEEQQRHDLAYQLIYQMLYYISITADNIHVTKNFATYFGLDEAVYLLRLPKDVDSDVTAINLELRHKLDKKIELLCYECKLLITILPLPAAQIISQLKRLRDCLFSSQQFSIANEVSAQIEHGIDGLQAMFIAELCDRMITHYPEQIVIQSKQEYNQVEMLMECLSSILSVLSHIIDMPSQADLEKIQESFKLLAIQSQSLAYPDIHTLATELSMLLYEIINHQMSPPVELLSLIDESCDLIPELIECISLHKNPDGITANILHKISLCRANRSPIKPRNFVASDVDHYFLQELKEIVAEFSVKHLLAQKMVESVTNKLQSCYAKDHLNTITELALQTKQVLETEWQLHKLIQQKLSAVLIVPYEHYVNELVVTLDEIASKNGVRLNIEFHTDGEMIERTKATIFNELLALVYQHHINGLNDHDEIQLELSSMKDNHGTIFIMKISPSIEKFASELDIKIRRVLHRLSGTMKMTHDDCFSMYTFSIPITTLTAYASIVTLGDDKYALPTHQIDAVIKLEEIDVDTRLVEKITHNGHVYHLYHLHTLLGKPAKHHMSIHDETNQQVFFCYQVNGQSCAVYVDTFIQNEEVVIKPLSMLLQQLPGILGATLFQNQSLALVLDVPCLIREYLLRENTANNERLTSNIEQSYER